jgi:hypothetical protein
MSAPMAKGWGYLHEIRRTGAGLEALIQFNDEEAPRWISYPELAAHRRQLLTAKRQLITS